MTHPSPLAPDLYTKGEPFMREKATIFASQWLPLAPLARLAKPGDFASATIGGWPLVAVRGDDALRGFRNTCRHQNMMVVEQPAGNAEVLRCRYHGWTYGLDGRFRDAPALVAPAELASDANHLQAAAIAQWGGLAFVSLDATAAPFAPGAEADAFVAGAGSALAGEVMTDIGCNWKVLAEMRLGDPLAEGETGRSFAFPLLAVRRIANGVVIEQIMARSFLRTRLVSYLFSDDPSALDWMKADAAATRTRAEAAQSVRAAGEADALLANPAVRGLHEKVLALTS